MLPQNDRAFKEWAIACDAMRDGRQLLLIRKGGIREEGGVFTMTDREFFLMPTFEHQNPDLVQAEILPRLDARRSPPDPGLVEIDTYAEVDTILIARDEAHVRAAAYETIWNDEYIRQRFDFNAYDPLYLVVLRAHRLREPISLPLAPEYIGCRSWVTLDRAISTEGARPSLSDAEFAPRRARVLELLQS
jgi:hypothetical protein